MVTLLHKHLKSASPQLLFLFQRSDVEICDSLAILPTTSFRIEKDVGRDGKEATADAPTLEVTLTNARRPFLRLFERDKGGDVVLRWQSRDQLGRNRSDK